MNNKTVARLFATKAQPRAKSLNMYFEGDTIYSHGPHFPIARHFKDRVFFNNEKYSQTTTRHQRLVRIACREAGLFVLNSPSGAKVKTTI